ncbi:MAG: dCTP deaminase [Planctomycetes bacterium]|nr:dCTP deaminase [Planctomycetota bacterium]
MLLSNLEIHKALDTGRLVIKPEPLPRTKDIGVKYCPYDTHTVDLRLGNELTIPKPGAYAYDFLAQGNIAELIAQSSKKHTLTEDRPFRLEPYKFVLAQTLETIELPIDKGPPYLAARIEGKSSRARCGLLVHFTAPTVHPEWKGQLTLEIINLGQTPFLLHSGMPIAQLLVEQVKGEIKSNQSQFQGQVTPEGL